jgi:ribA/ribD-fused uncharacterized protein
MVGLGGIFRALARSPSRPPGRGDGPLSNWAASPFRLDGRDFHCLEQYLMWRKAVLFRDAAAAGEILACRTAPEAKARGREIAGFDEIAWYCRGKSLLYRGARLGKFAQHAPSREALLETAGTILVEASNSDPVWGVGLAEYDRRCWDLAEWRGTNWLGEVLTTVRESIFAEMARANERKGG